MNWDIWGAPIGVLCAGVVAGLVLIMRSKGAIKKDPTAEAFAKKDSLVDQLRALKADQGKLPSAAFERRWTILLDQAALALRQAEGMASHATDDTDRAIDPDATQPLSVNKAGRRWMWAIIVVAFFSGLGAVLKTATSTRGQGATMTGGAIVAGKAMSEQVAALEATAQAEPANITPINQLAHLAIQSGDLGRAMKWMDAARALQPDHPEVRTHLAILQVSVGMVERGKLQIEAALSADPLFSEALLWKGLIALEAKDRETAVSALEAALENAGDRSARLMATQALAEARKPPPVVALRGSLSLKAGTTGSESGVLFIMVRNSAEAQGPPTAAVRLDPRGIPGSFVITDRDIMMGGPWPEQVWVEARLDADGDPSTKSPSDLKSERLGPFSAGTENIELVLASSATNPVEPGSNALEKVSGVISFKAGITPPTQGNIFVIVRRTPTPQGPPVAALKLSPDSRSFSVSEDDIMMGGPWPKQVWVQVRSDADGNAMTKGADDFSSAVVGPISAGTTDITLVLSTND